MGADTGIPWCDMTFNTHWGCAEVSPECDNCYARTFAGRFGHAWGKDAPRRFFGDKHWNDLLRWNRAAERGKVGKDGRRILVFVDSMSDLFESREDLDPVRAKFWDYARSCRALRFLLLTKRPQNIGRMVPADLIGAEHLWYGTTVGHPDSMWRVDALIKNTPRAAVRFLSVEPLIGDLDFGGRLDYCEKLDKQGISRRSDGMHIKCESWCGISWVIVGSESGDGARPMDPAWMRGIRDACIAAGVPLFVKQADEGTDGISAAPPVMTASHELPARNAPYRRRDLRSRGDGSKRVHWIIERPYLDGKQHVEWPQ